MIEELEEYLVRYGWSPDIASEIDTAYGPCHSHVDGRQRVRDATKWMDDVEHEYSSEAVDCIRRWQHEVGENVWPFQLNDFVIAGLDDIDPVCGFTFAEKRCNDALMLAYQEFIDLPRQHPDEMRDFVDPLHRLQDLLAVRIARRLYPQGWPVKA